MSNATRVSVVASAGALEASRIISATGANLQEIACTNTSASAVYCQVYNTATVPADTAVPVLSFAVPASSSASYDNQQGIVFDTGICVAISTTAHVKTIATAVATFFALIEG